MLQNVKILYRLPLLVISFIALIFGVAAGLARLGLPVAAFRPDLAVIHGPLMIAGFLGTLISLERAVAMDRLWSYSAPAVNGIGMILLLTGFSPTLGSFFLIGGSGGLIIILWIFLFRQPALFSATLVLGAITLLIGNIFLYLDYPVYDFVLWWIGFLVFTIAGERLELSRLVKISRQAQTIFFILIMIFIAGLFSTSRIVGMAMLAISIWLLRYDVASKTMKHPGLPRFIAICLLSGNIWLGVGGVLTSLYGDIGTGTYYDASLHSVLLGFVFAMIFGHAPIIFPAVAGISIPFRRRFYIHLILLHLSLLLRLAGDFSGIWPFMQWGGLLNALSLLLFLLNTASAALSIYLRPSPPS